MGAVVAVDHYSGMAHAVGAVDHLIVRIYFDRHQDGSCCCLVLVVAGCILDPQSSHAGSVTYPMGEGYHTDEALSLCTGMPCDHILCSYGTGLLSSDPFPAVSIAVSGVLPLFSNLLFLH